MAVLRVLLGGLWVFVLLWFATLWVWFGFALDLWVGFDGEFCVFAVGACDFVVSGFVRFVRAFCGRLWGLEVSLFAWVVWFPVGWYNTGFYRVIVDLV